MKRSAVHDFWEPQQYLAAANIRLERQVPGLVVYRYGQLTDAATVAMAAYRHHYFEITLDITSACSFQVDSFAFPAAGQRIAFISPQRLQSVQPAALHQSSGFTLFFQEQWLGINRQHAALLRDLPQLRHTHSPVLSLSEKAMREFADVFDRLHYEYTEYGAQAQDVLRAYVHVLLGKGKQHAPLPASATPLTREQEIVQEYQYHCQQHYRTVSTVAQVAQRMHLSAKHVSETVKRVTGRNALALLNDYRLAHAKALLLHLSLIHI